MNIKIHELGLNFGYNGKSLIYHIIPSSRMTQSYLNKRIGNSGYCHIYTWYRAKNPTNRQIILKSLKVLFHRPAHISYLIAHMIHKRDIQYIRFMIPYTYYYKNQIKYILKLLFNPMFKKIVQKRDWLTNDNEFDSQLITAIKGL